MHLDGRKQKSTRYEVLCARLYHAFQPRSGKRNSSTNEPWYTMLYHMQPNNTTIISSMVLCIVRTVEKKGKRKRDKWKIQNGKNERRKRSKTMRSRCRPSPEDKVAGTISRLYDLSSWWTNIRTPQDTRRPDGRKSTSTYESRIKRAYHILHDVFVLDWRIGTDSGWAWFRVERQNTHTLACYYSVQGRSKHIHCQGEPLTDIPTF